VNCVESNLQIEKNADNHVESEGGCRYCAAHTTTGVALFEPAFTIGTSAYVATAAVFALNCAMVAIVTPLVFTGTMVVGATLSTYVVELIVGISLKDNIFRSVSGHG
jgi:hypothetical protein